MDLTSECHIGDRSQVRTKAEQRILNSIQGAIMIFKQIAYFGAVSKNQKVMPIGRAGTTRK